MAAKAKKKVRKIRIAIADDHQLFLKGMALLIKGFDDMRVIIEAENGKELLEKIKEKQPDIVLMDLEMPVLDGMDATALIRKKYPDIKIIGLTQYDDDKLIGYMMREGASAYLLKTSDPEKVEDVIWAVMEKGSYYNEKVARAMHKGLADQQKKPGFAQAGDITERELNVLKLVCKELTTIEIGDRLCITASAVEKHRQSLLHKLNVKNTAGLVKYAMENGLAD